MQPEASDSTDRLDSGSVGPMVRAVKDLPMKSVEQMCQGCKVELDVQGILLTGFVDCGSSINLFSATVAKQLELEVQKWTETFRVADTKRVKALGYIPKVKMQCAETHLGNDVYIFPKMDHELIL